MSDDAFKNLAIKAASLMTERDVLRAELKKNIQEYENERRSRLGLSSRIGHLNQDRDKLAARIVKLEKACRAIIEAEGEFAEVLDDPVTDALKLCRAAINNPQKD